MRTSTTAKFAALAALLAILSSAAAPPARAADAGPIKVALLAPTSGSAAAAGHDMVAGWTLYWKEHNDKVAGRTVQTTVYDTASNPTHALDQARHAVEQDGAQIVVGPYLANEGLAVAPYTIQHRIPLFLPTVSADDLSQRMANAFVIKVAGWSSSLPTHPAGEWAYEQGHRKMVTLANSYAFGYENAGGFAQTFTQKGGKIVDQIWAPLGTADYSPYISRVQAAAPDALFVEMVGADAVHFLTQWSQLGLKNKIPLIANETTTDQSNIRSIAPDIVEGITSFGHFAECRDAAATRVFIDKYGKAEGVLPSYMATGFYTAAQWIAHAIENIHGNTSDPGVLLRAVREIKLPDSPFGPMTLDQYGAPVENVYVRKVVATSGEAAKYAKTCNAVVKTYPSVSQFWTWRAADYLKQPVYSPSYQGYAK
ncbi:MAG: penicillin-binding protein activator [Candidatus Eremiobacteraeota bacterium]|nr:penicillin-binding protein activator [Candidatus Eremiobacteraeota bacterium]